MQLAFLWYSNYDAERHSSVIPSSSALLYATSPVDEGWYRLGDVLILTDLKRIQTPHSLLWGFGGDKTFTTCWSGGRVQVWVQVRAPAGPISKCHLEITPEGYSRRQSKVLTANQWPSSWGRAPAQLGWVGRASTKTGVSESAAGQSLRAATGLLEEKLLALFFDTEVLLT